MSASPPVRWGILSTASIARKNWQAILHSGNAVVAAVASRDAAKSAGFIAECQRQAPFAETPAALGSYEELIASPDVDAVYIPLPTGLRKEWVIRAASAGKHVLCEKPCAPSATDLVEMTEACAAAGVQFMDGIMYMHTRRLAKILEVLDEGSIVGDVKRIACGFSFCADEAFLSGNIRSDSRLEPHGCLGDLGWYTIRFALMVRRGAMPEKVTGRLLATNSGAESPAPVPTEFSAELLWNDGVSATFYNSFLTEHQEWAHVSGTRGSLHVPDFVLPYFGNETAFTTNQPVFEIDGCDFAMESHAREHRVREHANSHPTSQEATLFRNFSNLAASGKLDPIWPELALKTQRILDACYRSALDGSREVQP